MKRVRKYTYLPQEEIEVIETKSGQTIKSKEILDGNYVKAKPAPKKVVKKAVKKIVRKKYAKGGKLVGNQKKLDVNKNGKLDAEDFKMLRASKMADGGMLSLSKHYKTLGKKDDLVGLKVYDKSNDEFVYIKNVDSGIFAGKNKNDELGHNYTMSDLMVQTMENGGYMADGGEIEVGDKVLAKYAKYHATVTEIVDDVEVPYAKITYSDGRVKKADLQNLRKVTLGIAPEYVNPGYMATGGEVNKHNYMMLDRLRSDNEYYLGNGNRHEKHLWAGNVDGQIAEMKKLWNELPKDKKPEWLSMEDIENYERKMKGNKMADGGSIVKDWELKSNGRYYATFFLMKNDPRYRLITEHGVTESIEDVNGGYELTISVTKEGKDFFENYEGLDANGNPYTFKTMAKGGKTPIVRTQFEEEEFEYADGGRIKVGTFNEEQLINKEDKKAVEKAREESGLKYVDTRIIKKGGKMYMEVYLIPNEEYYNSSKFSKGGYMAKGGMMDEVNTEVIDVKGNIMGTTSLQLKISGMRKPQDFIVYPISTEQAGEPITIQSDTRFGYLDLSSGRGLMSQSHSNGAYSYHFSIDKKVPFKISETDVQKIKEHLSSRASSRAGNSVIFSDNSGAGMMANGGEVRKLSKMERNRRMMADGGKVTDKEVAESNVEMLHSNIKSIKHHAEELEHAIKDNTEVEGWVLAKADRAATAMSDITHYLDGRKMGTGGMVAGHYYKDKAGSDFRYIGPDSKNNDLGIFKDGEKYLTKPFNEFEEEKEKKSFWFGNGGFMPSGFSRKVTLSEKAEEMVGKNTWHILDAAQKGEVIGELISDGALAVTMDRGGIVDADDWSKSMTQDKIYALKKAGYSENIASEMSLLPYEQLPMWVRQDFKKGSIVIGAYHIHKNDNIPVDGKVLVLNGDEEVVYSAETLDQAQEWAINQMQEVEDEDDGNYIYVSDCCGAEAGSSYDIGICPMCREHCEWEKESTYADGGVTEATKFKVVYKLRDAAEPKEKLFDNAEKAEFFLETIKDDDDIMSANLVEVKPMKKAAEKKAPTNLFAAAKPAAASSASKKTKEDVLVPGIADRIARYDALKAIIKNAEAEKEVIGGTLKEVGKEKFLELYELRRRNPETFNLADENEKIMFIVMDKYIKVEPEKAGMLENYPGLLETTTTYKFNPALLDKTGEIVSRLILESTELSDDEKANLIVAETKIGIKSGSIDRLMDYDNPSQIFDLIEPILALK